MAISAQTAGSNAAPREHGFHTVGVKDVVSETAEAKSFVLDIPEQLRPAFAYRAGQFVTFRVQVGGQTLLRSYSMSSAPEMDRDLQVTVKRVPGGLVSNWMNDRLAPGDQVDVTGPAGVFCVGPGDGDIVALAAGSGITPVLSIVKSALETTTRRVRLLYANRDRESVIFGAGLDRLAARHPGRLDLVHHLDVERGFVQAGTVRAYVPARCGDEHYICGPGPFMDIAERALLAEGVPPERIHIERFTPAPRGGPADPPDAAGGVQARVTITVGGRSGTAEHRQGTTILHTARQLGLSPPSSCEAGDCATCMARVVEGAVTMRVNNALTQEEVDEGWVLTCQGVPASPSVAVVYEEG